MADPAESENQNLLPVQAFFSVDGEFQTFIGQGQPFYATVDPDQSGLHITNSTIDSTTIGATTPSTGVFTNVSTTTGTISTAPTANTDITNKAYVDAVAAGLNPKQAVKCATTANITLSGLQTIDAYTTLVGDRVLVKNQSTSSENGIYIAGSGAWTRATDMDVWAEVPGAYTVILNGGQGQTGWVCIASDAGTIGVTAMPWVQFSGSATYYAGTGLSLAANTFSITNTGVTAATKGSASKTVTAAVNAQGQLTSLTDQDIAIAGTQVTSGLVSPTVGGTGVNNGANTLTWNASYSLDQSVASSAAPTFTGTNFTGIPNSGLTYSSITVNGTSIALGASGTITAVNPNALTLGTGLSGTSYNGSAAVTAAIANTGVTANSYTYGSFTVNAQGQLTAASSNATTGTGSIVLAAAPTVSGEWSAFDSVSFNTSATPTSAVGKIYWDGGTTLNIGMTTHVTQKVGEDQFYYVKASSAITKGQLCYFTGVVGASSQITVAPAGAGITNGDYFVGLAAESIALNGFGLIQSIGSLKGFDTSAFVDGDVLYYDSVSGGMTNVYPATGIIVVVAAVTNASSGGAGSVQIRVSKTQRITAGSGISVSQSAAGSTVSISAPVSIANGGTNTTTTPVAGAVAYGTGSAYAFTSTGTTGQVLTSNGSSTPTWTTPASAITISDDTTTNATRYPLFSSATTGEISTEYVSSTKYQFNPSTGVLTSTSFTGAGTGLTGTASSLSIGGNAATATSATTATNLAGGAAGSLPYQASSGSTTLLAAGSNGQILTLASGVPSWAAAPVTGITITDDTTTNATRYLTFTSATTGSVTGENVSSTKLQFNPSTGSLSSTSFSGAGTGLTGTASSLSIGGNAATVTNGVYTSVSYADPTWITSLAGSKISGNISGNAGNVTGTVAIANGGSGQTTAQGAMNSFAGAVTSGSYLRGNGTNVVMSTIQAADVPTLNQNTTGSAGSVANALSVGTGLSYSSGTTFNGSVARTLNLANTAVSAGSYTNAAITVDAQGRLTSASSGTAPVTSVGATGPITSSGGTTPTIGITQATTSTNGYLSSTDWNTFNSKGSGTVTSVSVASANGFTGSSSGGATPTLTLATSITGVIKGNGTAISAATEGTDYSVGTSALATGILKSTTATGALSIAVAADFPTLNQNTTGTAANITASSNSTLTTLSALSLPGSQVSGNISGNAANVTGTVAIVNGGTGQTTASAAFNALAPVTTTGDLIVGNGVNSSTRLPIGTNGYVLTSNGTTATWSASSSGLSISDDTTTNAERYLTFTDATTGSITAENVSSSKLKYNPSTGTTSSTNFTASGTVTGALVNATNGIVINSQTVAASYSIPSGSSAMSAGPITVASGQSVTVASGSRWVVL